MTCRLNISIDDVSPHPLSGLGFIDRCYTLINRWPDVKFTFFIPTAYWRTCHVAGRPDTRTSKPLFLKDHIEFCQQLCDLPESNFEFCLHGRYHGIPGQSNNDEFRYISESDFISKYSEMWDDIHDASLACERDLLGRFKRVVRPPAMYMSPAAIKSCDRLGIRCLALSPRKLHTDSYQNVDRTTKNVVYANCWLPDDDPMIAVKTNLQVEMLYHACEWDAGYFSDTMLRQLTDCLAKNDVEFSFIEGLL